jgi:hypothetical protein
MISTFFQRIKSDYQGLLRIRLSCAFVANSSSVGEMRRLIAKHTTQLPKR